MSFAYHYNSANQRTSVISADSSYWLYQYDSLGQVTSGKKYWSDNTPVAGQQFEYSFDDIGNRKSSSFGGDSSAANLRSTSYSVNNLNQYTSRNVAGYLEVSGSAKTNATVSLWTSDGCYASTSRKGEYYSGELALNNSTGALWLTITNLAVLNNGTNSDIVTNFTGNAFVTKTPEQLFYDLDGNLVKDGRWTNIWDAENRLISMESVSRGPDASKRRLTFRYDSNWRRVSKKLETWSGSAWITTLSNKFLYDGWNLIAELNGTNNAVIRTYTWGTDLSGTQQGAGGVGGLLTVSDATLGSHFAAFDGNGNVSALISAADGTNSAIYEYSAFSEVIRVDGPMSKANPLRFSTRFQDAESGLLYYGFRHYDPSLGRWTGRDPILEHAFTWSQIPRKSSPFVNPIRGDWGAGHPSAFVLNDPIDNRDVLGLCTPGCNQAACVVRVVAAGQDADTKETVGELVELADVTDKFGIVFGAGTTGAASVGELAEAVAAGTAAAADQASTSIGGALAKLAASLREKMGPHQGGWTPWTRMSYRTCKARCGLGRWWTGDAGYWDDLPPSEWAKVAGDGDLGDSTFDGPERALAAGNAACKKALKDYKSHNKVCEW